MRQIIFARIAQKRAIAAFIFKSLAYVRVMAAAGKGPHIMQRPDDRFAGIYKFFKIVDRKKAGVGPMKMQNVRILYQWVIYDACAGVCGRKSKTHRLVSLMK